MTRDRRDTFPSDLDPKEWARLSAILDEVMDLPPPDVSARLDVLCASDPELRGRVETWLRADAEATGFLERPPAFLGELIAGIEDRHLETDPAEYGLEPGRRIGPFLIEREVGRGGMGAVYLATRADGQFDQEVAIKLVRTAVGGPDSVARFLDERRILARLQHPHIARLLDGGMTGEGLPYFAMEFVKGTVITDYCAEHELSLPDTLGLFAQACRAVAYAHQNLVVHRDLKPSNILVSDAGQVKLVDFGIAKALEPGSEGPLHTLTRVMTPHYASPEQIRGEAPTTATDVYALGVVLYELLTGQRPYGNADSSPPAVSKAVLEEKPRPPSTVHRSRRAAIASRNEIDPAPAPSEARRAPWIISRDLDNIVLKTLRKDPEERYPSAEALLDDIDRLLAHQPVRACPPTLRYVAGKFIRRNRLLVAVVTVAALSMVGGMVGTVWQARVAARERDRARLEAQKATELKDFALSLFAYSDPYSASSPDITARRMLDEGLGRIGTELKEQPAVRAEMYGVLGQVYRNLGLADTAESLAVVSLELNRSLYGEDHDQVAAALHNLGSLAMDRGEYEPAIDYLERSLAIRTHLHGDAAGGTADDLNELALVWGRLGEHDRADSLHRRVLALDEGLYGRESPKIITDLNNLGANLNGMDRSEDALPVLERALALCLTHYGADNLNTVDVMGNLAMALDHLDREAEAESLWTQGLAVQRRLLSPGHNDISITLENLARLALESGDYDRARALYLEALAIREPALGPRHPSLAQLHNNLATLSFKTGGLEDAANRFSSALDVLRASLGEDHPSTLTCENNLAVVLRDLHRFDEAEPLLRDVLARRIAVFGEDHPQVAFSRFHLGVFHHLTGRLAEAETELRRALAIRVAEYGEDHPLTVMTRDSLAATLEDEGRPEESRALRARAHGDQP